MNLPSLWYHLAGVSPERILRSVRSLVSLGSNRSSGGSLNKDSGTGKKAARSHSLREQSMESSPSDALSADQAAHNIAYPDGRSVETFEMNSLPAHQTPSGEVDASQGIQVDRSIQFTEEQV